MGKKSKRRIGKRKKQRDAWAESKIHEDVIVNNEREVLQQHMDELTLASVYNNEEFDNYESMEKISYYFDIPLPWTVEEKEAFEEFMLWSLRGKAYLTTKSFERLVIAKMIVEGKISIEDITLKRSEILEKIDRRITSFEMQHGIHLLMEGIKFDSFELESDFRLQLAEVLEREHRYLLPLLLIAHDSFQETISKFSNKGGVCLENCPFFGLTEHDFNQRFNKKIGDMVESSFRREYPQEINYMCVILSYYMHRSGTTKLESSLESFGNTIYAQTIIFSLLELFEEMHSCWRCKQLHLQGEGEQAKTLICASCKCAVYCSRECQIKDWKEGRSSHKKCCENISLRWSLHYANKRRVGKALRKGRIFTKPVTVKGIERECFLRPSELLDYYLCCMRNAQNTRLASLDTFFSSMDAFYENMARLACGGTHPIFGEDTISLKLQEKIRKGYEDIFLDFDCGSFTKEQFSTVLNIAVVLKYQIEVYGRIAPSKHEHLHGFELSVDQFITLYICYEAFDLHKQTFRYDFDRFRLEQIFLQELKAYQNEEKEEHKI
ncbi:hypothetical protein CTEN210_04301 [Chaetoceros tenuissimus]|uniref:MYND-type domain-containing protein n=1 Tax=Chaetoceros tenuissimus TaxID=426638 RepID=A0AAD3H2D2_9STRA|nr:hypothetical protein CTEN210_04301 [Chaetoceros tenuissimus]